MEQIEDYDAYMLGRDRESAWRVTDPYNAYAQRMAGVQMQPSAAPPYPLYGVPHAVLGQPEEVPFYKRPLVTFVMGAAVVGALWAYFDVWKPREEARKKER